MHATNAVALLYLIEAVEVFYIHQNISVYGFVETMERHKFDRVNKGDEPSDVT